MNKKKIYDIYKVSRGKFYNKVISNIINEKSTKKYYLLNYNII